MTKKKYISFFQVCIVLMLLFATTGCKQGVILDKNNTIPGEAWDYSNKQTFEAAIEDTAVRYDLYVNIRHSFHFEWRNLWVNIETVFPDGKKIDRRVNLLLSEADGQWFGDCTNDQCFIEIPIQENAIFPQTGNYKFAITQDMRVNPLKYINSVGMRVEKRKK